MVSKIPVWVFFVFVALVVLGVRQARTREVPVALLTGLAAGMFGLSLYGVVAAFGANVVAVGAWALGLATSVTFGRGMFGPRGLVPVSASRVRVPGSWLPLALMMAIFVAKFALGFATGVGLPVVAQPGFMFCASALFGLLSGAFTARAVVVAHFMREARAAQREEGQVGELGALC